MEVFLNKALNYFIAFALGLILPIHTSMLCVAVLVFTDAFTGIVAALKRGERFESKKLKQTVVKMCLYEVVIVIAHMIELHIFGGLFPLLNTCLSIISMVEFSSLVENLTKYTGNDVGKLIKAKIAHLLNPAPINVKEEKPLDKKEEEVDDK